MIIAVVSDTHGHVANAKAAARVVAPFEPAAVLHAGDIGSAAVMEQFAAWPTHFVLGNTDDDEAALKRAALSQQAVWHGRFADIELAGRRIALLHGDDRRRMDDAIASGRYALVCYGHTHVAAQRRAGETLVLNPGALFRASQHTIAIVDLADMTATHVVVQ